MSDNNAPSQQLRRFFYNSAIILFWLAFFYIWGPWGPLWQSGSDLFSPKWWLDTLGHALVGFVFPAQLVYYYFNYSASKAILLNDEEKLKWRVLWNTAKLAMTWELGEMVFDYFRLEFYQFLDKAQKGSVDTTVDIIITAFMAELAMSLYVLYKKSSRKMHPETYAEIDRDLSDISLRIKNVTEKIRSVNREHRRELKVRLKQSVKKLAQSLREKND